MTIVPGLFNTPMVAILAEDACEAFDKMLSFPAHG
jgi:hypothetical protein